MCDEARVSVVVSYCNNERPFLDALLTECRKFSDDVLLCAGTHTYDGAPDPAPPITSDPGHEHDGVRVLTYDVDVSKDTRSIPWGGVARRPTAYWHNLSRWTGIQEARHPWILLLDADEIPEGDAFAEWVAAELPHTPPSSGYVFKLANHWYFKHTTLRADAVEDSVVLAPKWFLSDPENVFGDAERDLAVQNAYPFVKRRVKHHLTRAPMFHHFSFVRPDIRSKISSWAHRDDLLPPESAERFLRSYEAADAGGREPIHGYNLLRLPSAPFGLEF